MSLGGLGGFTFDFKRLLVHLSTLRDQFSRFFGTSRFEDVEVAALFGFCAAWGTSEDRF